MVQSESTCTCNVSSDVCRAYVNTHLLFFTKCQPNIEFLHMSTPWPFHVSCETLHRFNPVLSDIRQLHHQAAVQSRLRVVSFSKFSICAVCSSFHLTHGESTPFAPNNFMVFKGSLNKLRVSFQRHFVVQHIDFDCSIQDLQLLRVTCRESNVPRFASPQPVSRELSRNATASVVPLHRSRHRDTIL